jgi:polyhydroxybutyrate depolymerase
MLRILIALFIITSCSGGGSSNDSFIDTVIDTDNNQNNNEDEQCEQFEDRVFKCEFNHGNLLRYYYIHLPHPEAQGASSVLFNLHGYGSNALAQMQYGDFRSLANTKENNFILIHPQGAPLNTALTSSESHWNSGGWTIGSTVDDVDFINTIIRFISQKYNINQDRIYSTGMSNGGFMSYHLACNLSSKIAAVASVTGSMSVQTYDDCNPYHPTSVLQVHGTIDGTVPLNGNSALGMESIYDVIEFWRSFNSCIIEPVINTTDYFDLGYSVEHQTFNDCLNNNQVELYIVDGMWHTWPREDNFGISASNIIWDFINTYDINGKIN